MYERIYVVKKYNPIKKKWISCELCSTADEAFALQQGCSKTFGDFAVFEHIYDNDNNLIFVNKIS